MIYDLLVQLWNLFVSNQPIPDYITEALNWVSFSFMLLLILSPIILLWAAFALVGKVGKYD